MLSLVTCLQPIYVEYLYVSHVTVMIIIIQKMIKTICRMTNIFERPSFTYDKMFFLSYFFYYTQLHNTEDPDLKNFATKVYVFEDNVSTKLVVSYLDLIYG